MKPLILGINGSPHKKGTTTNILKLVLKGAEKQGAKTKIVDLYELKIIHEPGYYNENPKKETQKIMPKDGIVLLYPEIIKANGLVLTSFGYSCILGKYEWRYERFYRPSNSIRKRWF